MKNCAVIIENRLPLSEISKIATNHFKYLDETYNFQLFDKTKIKTLSDYNRFLTSHEFWKKMRGYEKVLIFQHDSEILREGIKEFYDYDYVGAPWKFQEHGGNGGLSLRSVEACTKTLELFPYQGESVHGYEDVYFSNHIQKTTFKLAPREVCKKFSCETIFELGTFGAHAIDKYLTKEQCNKIRAQYNG